MQLGSPTPAGRTHPTAGAWGRLVLSDVASPDPRRPAEGGPADPECPSLLPLEPRKCETPARPFGKRLFGGGPRAGVRVRARGLQMQDRCRRRSLLFLGAGRAEPLEPLEHRARDLIGRSLPNPSRICSSLAIRR